MQNKYEPSFFSRIMLNVNPLPLTIVIHINIHLNSLFLFLLFVSRKKWTFPNNFCRFSFFPFELCVVEKKTHFYSLRVG